MPEIEPLSAEEILFVRRMYNARRWFFRSFYAALATALAGAVAAILLS